MPNRSGIASPVGAAARVKDPQHRIAIQRPNHYIRSIAPAPLGGTYPFGELDMLVPAYAVTIHKSQGSEYPAVVIPVVTQHYTVLVGQRKAIAIAIRATSRLPRVTPV